MMPNGSRYSGQENKGVETENCHSLEQASKAQSPSRPVHLCMTESSCFVEQLEPVLRTLC